MMIRRLNILYNAIFRCSLFIMILAILCKITDILSLDSYIFGSDVATVITAAAFLAIAFAIAGYLRHIVARLQERHLK